MADERVENEQEVEEVEEYRFDEMPETISFGAVASCPSCRSRGIEPGTKSTPCGRCNGFGIVPNKGPVVSKKP